MKKLLAAVLSIAMLISLSACSGSGTSSGQTSGGTSGSSSGGSATQSDTDFPTRNINILCPWSAGGGSDMSIRLLVPYLEEELGVSVTVVNRTGANGWIAWNELLQSEPDGYTIAQLNIPTLYSGYLDPQQNRDVTLDDFQVLCNQISDWGTMVVRKGDERFSTAEELLEYAKSNELIVADNGVGTNKHILTVELMENIPELKLVPMHQSGWSDSYASLLGGHIDVGWGSVGEVLSAYQAGEVDILCVFAPERSEFMPDVPTFNELNLGCEILSPSDRGFVLPAGVDEEVYNILLEAFSNAIQNPEHIEASNQMGLEVNYIGGEEYDTYVRENEQSVRDLAGAMGWE